MRKNRVCEKKKLLDVVVPSPIANANPHAQNDMVATAIEEKNGIIVTP